MAEKVVIGNAVLWRGDCVEVMRTMADNLVDAVVSDPPLNQQHRKKAMQILLRRNKAISGDWRACNRMRESFVRKL